MFNLFLLSFSSVNLLHPLRISTYSTVPEFKDPVFFRENKPKALVFNDWKRSFRAYFRKNWVYKFGHFQVDLIFSGGLRCNTEVIFPVQYNILECIFSQPLPLVLTKIL